MKKSILNLGTALNKEEQKEVIGGMKLAYVPQICGGFTEGSACSSDADCCDDYSCVPDTSIHSGLDNDCDMGQPGCFGGQLHNLSSSSGRCMAF